MNKQDMIKETARLIKLEAEYNIKLSKLISKYYNKNLKKVKKQDLSDELGIATIEMENAKEQYESAKHIYENPEERCFAF